MGKIGKISPIKRVYDTTYGSSLSSSLAKEGYAKFPGTIDFKQPYKERNGTYRTGLDPNAFYIQQMLAHPETKDAGLAEQKRVTELKADLEARSGLKLDPNSDYYTRMFEHGFYNTTSAAKHVRLYDMENTFNLDNVNEAITFAWLRVHPEIAPNYNAWEKNVITYQCPNPGDCGYYVDDEDYESEVTHNNKIAINKAIAKLEGLSITKRKKVAKLLGLPVDANTKEVVVYNLLDDFIKSKDSKGISNVNLFNSLLAFSDENFNLQFLVQEAVDLNVYREGKGGKLFEGQTDLKMNKSQMVDYLTSPKHQDELLALEEKVKAKRAIEF